MGVGNPLGLIALGALGILILLYFFFMRPTKKVFPSIMFFFKEEKASKKKLAWKQFSSNILFILQFLIILLAALAIADFFLTTPSESAEDHTIIVLDVSASMQAAHEGNTRFEEARKEALSLVDNAPRISIIAASAFPLLAVEDGTTQEARTFLREIEATDTESSLGDALLQAGSVIRSGTVHVISDFSGTIGVDVAVAKRQLNAEGTRVVFHPITSGVFNTGIIDGFIRGNKATLKIKNFGSRAIQTTLSSNTTQRSITLDEGGVEEVTMTMLPGENIFTLEPADEFPLDNVAYFSLPTSGSIKTLLVTNKESKDAFQIALESSGLLDITIARPPVLPQETYDLYIIYEVDKEKILPTTFEDIAKAVDKGSHAIVHAQLDSQSIDYKKLSLLSLNGRAGSTRVVDVIGNAVTHGITFGEASTHFITQNEDCLSWLASPSNETIVCQAARGEGTVTWYGLLSSSFRQTPDYPLFWDGLLRVLFQRDDDASYNRLTGTLFPYENVGTPGDNTLDQPIIQQAGFYSVGEETYAANLFSFQESNLNFQQYTKSDEGIGGVAQRKDTEKRFAKLFMLLALLFVIAEFLIVKWRGDL